MLQTIGRGSFGKVKEALHVTTNEKIAVKILEKAKIEEGKDEERVAREIDILNKAHHPNIIQVFEVVETSKYFFFIMELAGKGEITTYVEQKGR